MRLRQDKPPRFFSCPNLVLLLWTLAVLSAIRAIYVADSGVAPWGWWAIAALVLALLAIVARYFCGRGKKDPLARARKSVPGSAARSGGDATASATGSASGDGGGAAAAAASGASRAGAGAASAGAAGAGAAGAAKLSASELEREEQEMAAKLAALPDDATPEQRADAVGRRPKGLSAPEGGKADDLKRIKGIGRVNEEKLNGLGIYHFHQIAAWTREEVRWVTTYLAFPGRIDREDWLGQAAVLARGEETEFSKRVDAGEVASSLDKD